MSETSDPAGRANRVAVDVLVVGGGVQGLVALAILDERGYSTALVADRPLGSGQTLHMHGLINTGYPAPRPELRAALEEGWIPWARENGVDLYGSDEFFYVAPAEVIERKHAEWDEAGYPNELRPTSDLPAGFREGSLFGDGTDTRVIGVDEYCFSKRELVHALARDHLDRVVMGDVTGFECSVAPADGDPTGGLTGEVHVDAVHVGRQGGGPTVTIEPGCLVAATGVGTESFLESLAADPAFRTAAETAGVPTEAVVETVDEVTYTNLHMVCISGPESELPAVNAMIPTEKLRIAGHRLSDLEPGGRDDRVLWYVTPRDPEATVEHQIHDHDHVLTPEALGVLHEEVVGDGIETLLSVYPPLAAAAGLDPNGSGRASGSDATLDDRRRPPSGIEATAYAGIKQEFRHEPHAPFCRTATGTSNVVVTLPSVISGAWVNAERVVEMVGDRITPSGTRPSVPGGGERVSFGRHTENTHLVEWRDWSMFVREFLDV